MGLNRYTFRPAGFCFVECAHCRLRFHMSCLHLCRYYQRQHAIDAVCFCNGATLDDMEIRCELDPGFQKGREFGYGLSGGQSVDDIRLKPHSERPREQFVPWRNRAECACCSARPRAAAASSRRRYIRAKQQMGSTANREAEVLTAEDAADDQDAAAEPVKKQRPLALVTERFRAELAGSRAYERPAASLHGRRRRAGDLSMPDGDEMAAAAAGGGGGEDDGERGQDGDAPASRGRRERSRSASP